MWVKVTDPHTKHPQWVNLDAVGVMARRLVDVPQRPDAKLTDKLPPLIEVTRLFCAQGTIDCAETPEQILACPAEAGRWVLPKTVPVPPKPSRKGPDRG